MVTDLREAGALCEVLKVALQGGEKADIVLGFSPHAVQLCQVEVVVLHEVWVLLPDNVNSGLKRFTKKALSCQGVLYSM